MLPFPKIELPMISEAATTDGVTADGLWIEIKRAKWDGTERRRTPRHELHFPSASMFDGPWI